MTQVERETESAEEGRSGHSIIEDMGKEGKLPPGFPVDLGPVKQILPEAAFTYEVNTQEVRFLGCGIGRRYGTLGEFEIPMTIDLLVEHEKSLTVWDAKFVDTYVAPAHEHAQLGIEALAVAKYFKADAVNVAWTKYDRDALPDLEVKFFDTSSLDWFDLTDIAHDVKAEFYRWRHAVGEVKAGRHPNVTQGPHCARCPAKKGCIAHTGMMRAALGQPVTYMDALRDMMPDQIGELWERLIPILAQGHALKGEIEALVLSGTDIPTPSGKMLTRVQSEGNERVLDDEAAIKYVADRFGAEVALAAAKVKTSKGAIGEAVKAARKTDPDLKELWKSGKELEEHTLNRLRESGAIGRKPGKPTVEEVPLLLPAKKDEAA